MSPFASRALLSAALLAVAMDGRSLPAQCSPAVRGELSIRDYDGNAGRLNLRIGTPSADVPVTREMVPGTPRFVFDVIPARATATLTPVALDEQGLTFEPVTIQGTVTRPQGCTVVLMTRAIRPWTAEIAAVSRVGVTIGLLSQGCPGRAGLASPRRDEFKANDAEWCVAPDKKWQYLPLRVSKQDLEGRADKTKTFSQQELLGLKLETIAPRMRGVVDGLLLIPDKVTVKKVEQ
jgi:hypothetical protein